MLGLPSASVSAELMTPHLLSGSGGLSIVKLQRSIPFTSSVLDVGVSSATVEQGMGITSSAVAALQSSSTMLPRYSNAPGFTSSGFSHSPEATSQQSPSAGVQPSPSASGFG